MKVNFHSLFLSCVAVIFQGVIVLLNPTRYMYLNFG